MSNKEIKVNPKKWYTVTEALETGVFVGRRGKSSIWNVYRAIRSGKLKSRNVSTTDRGVYLLLGSDIQDYYKAQFAPKK